MKKAVGILTSLIEKEKSTGKSSAGVVLLATVKGDVHDIGKNIVGVVLGCNNYEIIDLGVMVPLEKVLDTAREKNADIVGLSGLITPSLDEMVYVAREMATRKLKTPLLIGGATTSVIHTAVKIDPEYSGSVIHVLDASRSTGVVGKLMNPEVCEGFVGEKKQDYQRLREEHALKQKKLSYVSLSQARGNKLKVDWEKIKIKKPTRLGIKAWHSYSLAEIAKYIDWSPFFLTWELKGKYPDILEHPKYGPEARILLDDAQKLLKRILAERLLEARAAVGLFPANSVNEDDIEIYTDDSRNKVLTTFHMLRQQFVKSNGNPNLCLSDYIAPKSSGVKDYLGGFVCTAGIGIDEPVKTFEKAGDDYNAIMMKALADRLAEAFAERLHERVRTEFWGYAKEESLTSEDLIRIKYQGIRPAPGYPACPEHTEKRILFDLLQAEKDTGVTLTESFAMLPAASISGFYFSYPESKYFAVGKITKDQIQDYAVRKDMDLAAIEKWLSPNLAYEPMVSR